MELLEQIESYLTQNHIPASRFGRLVMDDPRFVADLRGGRLPRTQTLEKVQLFLKMQ